MRDLVARRMTGPAFPAPAPLTASGRSSVTTALVSEPSSAVAMEHLRTCSNAGYRRGEASSLRLARASAMSVAVGGIHGRWGPPDRADPGRRICSPRAVRKRPGLAIPGHATTWSQAVAFRIALRTGLRREAFHRGGEGARATLCKRAAWSLGHLFEQLRRLLHVRGDGTREHARHRLRADVE